ncbi:MAG: hypothetical protein H7203_11100 [Rhizobacter sp.]|nr:hypothetical protein [Burkholderiales bacterium]
MKISVIGAGYVGLVTGACLDDLGNNFLCLYIDERQEPNRGCAAVITK